MGSKLLRLVTAIVIASCAIAFGWLNHWQVFEQDAFWLVRAGEEIIATGTVPMTDSWTHTVENRPWTHFQWLSSIVFYGAERAAGGVAGLVWLRSVLTALLFFAVGALIVRSTELSQTSTPQSDRSRTWAVLLWLLPWFYLMSWLRMQLRPDLFGLIFFAILVWLQLREDFTSRRVRGASLLLLVTWSNFHAGTVVFGIALFAAAQIFAKPSIGLAPGVSQGRARLQSAAWSLAAAATWFLTPAHLKILDVAKVASKIQNNPDLQPFRWDLLTYAEGGWSYSLLFGFLALAVIGCFAELRRGWTIKGAYRSRLFVISIFILFLYLFFTRIRALPYLAIFALPLAVLGLNAVFDRLAAGYKRVPYYFVAVFGVAAFFGWMVPDQKKLNVTIGDSVSAQWMPVDTVKFLRENRPKGQIYNHFNFGGYLIYALREYPVFHDGRETPFVELDLSRRLAMATPEKWAQFLRVYDINVVLDRIPQGADENAMYAKFYPSSEWARVASDFVSTVYVRRIDEHYELIRKFAKSGAMPRGGSTRPNLSDSEIRELIRQAEDEIRRRNSK